MKNLLLFVFVCSMFTITAQNYDFGKVSKEELKEKFNPLDSSARATYLYKYRKTFFKYIQNEGFELITEVHERIKVYNQEGFVYTTKQVNLRKSKSEEEKISNLKAYTYNLIDGKIEDNKLAKNGVFKTKQSEYLNNAKFTMPNIKEGSVIEYKYKITSPFFWNVEEFQFQHDIPIKKLEARFEVPEYFNFKVNTKGFLFVSPKNKSQRDRITFTSKTRNGGEGFSATRTTFNSSDIEFIKNISTYDLINVPALQDEPHVNNINNYMSAVQYELSYTKFPQSMIKYYSTTWEDVVKTIYESTSFGTELDKSNYYKDDIDELINSITGPTQQAAIIFNYVRSKVKWNGYYGKYVNDGVRKAYKDQVGNSAEINLMLTSMLRYAGLNANPVLVSTRNNGVPLFPTREGYNYVISCIEMPNGVILLDATSKYSSTNVLPFRVLNWKGRIIKKQGSSSLIDLYPNEKSKNTVFMVINLSDNGDIEGQMRNVKTTHDALLYREQYNNADKEDFLEKLENKYGGIEITDFEVKNDYDLSKPVMETYKFYLESQADIIGNKMYVSPFFFLRTKENPFKLEKREIPVDFGYPSSTKYMINIKLPDGYKVETLPEPKGLALPDNLGSYSYNISVSQDSIQLIINTQINEPIISSLYYEALKEYFKQFIEKENEQIVLIKI
jgi:Transglutaminase-like superfamily